MIVQEVRARLALKVHMGSGMFYTPVAYVEKIPKELGVKMTPESETYPRRS